MGSKQKNGAPSACPAIDEILTAYAAEPGAGPHAGLKSALSGYPSWLPYLTRKLQGGPAPLRKAALRALHHSGTGSGVDAVASAAADASLPSWLRREAAAVAGDAVPEDVRSSLETLVRPGTPEELLARGAAERRASLQAMVDGHAWEALDAAVREPRLADDALRAVVEHETAEAAAFLAGREGLSKDAEKAVRRALHALRQRGVAVEEVRHETAPAPRTAVGADQNALATHLDGRGSRAVIILVSAEGGASGEVLQLLLNDEHGLVEFHRLHGSPRQMRRVADDLAKENTDARLVPIDVADAWAIIREAYAASRRTGAEVPPGFVEAREQYEVPARAGATGGARAALPASDVAAAAGTEARLLARPEMRTWGPTPQELLEPARRVRELRASPIVANAALKESREADEVARLAAQYFDADRRARYVRRLEAQAAYLLAAGAREAACQALAAADSIQGAAPDAVPPFLLELYRRDIGEIVEALGKEESERLVVPPGGAPPAVVT